MCNSYIRRYMPYQIQNYLGEVVIESVSDEELANLLESEGKDEYTYFAYDSNPECDLVTNWAKEATVPAMNRIYKKI